MGYPAESTIGRRRRFIESVAPVGRCLEIGASHAPTYRKDETDVHFLDWFSRDELYQRFKETKPDRANALVEVDYVVKTKNFASEITERFDTIIANHVVEHVPDTIRWFRNVAQLLSPGGRVFLTVPHKEYTFDKLRNPTTTREVLENYDADLEMPSVYQIFEALHLYRPITAKDVWTGNYEHLLDKARFSVAESWRRANGMSGRYADVHCTVFTTESFLTICRETYELGLSPLRVVEYSDCRIPANEFAVALVADPQFSVQRAV